MKVNFYFAYGSNLDEPQMRGRSPDARVLSKGCLEGYRLDFTTYSSGWDCGVADIVRDEESRVWGVVYSISDSDFEGLDHYEGYPDLYTRFQTTVEMPSSSLPGVWVYTVRDKQAFVPPGREYLSIIKGAAVKYCFPVRYQEFLDRISLKD